MLDQAHELIANECGIGLADVTMMVDALRMADTNRREFVRLARLSVGGYSGKLVLNCDRGFLTDMRVDTSATALEKMLGSTR